MVPGRDRAPEFVVASLERVGDAVLRWTSRCPYARRGPVGHRRCAGILCKGSLRRVVAHSRSVSGIGNREGARHDRLCHSPTEHTRPGALWNLSAGVHGDIQYSGKLLAGDDAPTVKKGDWPDTRTVLVEFPGADAFDAWFNSPEYQALAEHRHAAS